MSSSDESPPASPAEDLYQDQDGSPVSFPESLELNDFVPDPGMSVF